MKPLLAPADVFVIGGGPAALAAPIAARERGLDVVVADCAVPPVDKASGEGIMPDGLAAARGLGIELPDADGFRFRGIGFHERGHSVAADFPNSRGLALRRTRLHELLVHMPSGWRVAALGRALRASALKAPKRPSLAMPAILRVKALRRRRLACTDLAEAVLYCFCRIRHRSRKRDRLLTCDRNGDCLWPFHFAYFQVLRLSPSDSRG